MSKKRNAAKLEAWAKARKRYRLSHEQVQMAREGQVPPDLVGEPHLKPNDPDEARG